MQETQPHSTWPLAVSPRVPVTKGGRVGLRGARGKGREGCECPRVPKLGGRGQNLLQGPLLPCPLPQPLVAMQFLWQQHPQTQLSPIV